MNPSLAALLGNALPNGEGDRTWLAGLESNTYRFEVLLRKGEDGLGFSIARGLVPGPRGGEDEHVILVKDLAVGGLAARDGRIRPHDRILEVDGESLVGVTDSAAATILRHTTGSVRLVLCRKRPPSPIPSPIRLPSISSTSSSSSSDDDSSEDDVANDQSDGAMFSRARGYGVTVSSDLGATRLAGENGWEGNGPMTVGSSVDSGFEGRTEEGGVGRLQESSMDLRELLLELAQTQQRRVDLEANLKSIESQSILRSDDVISGSATAINAELRSRLEEAMTAVHKAERDIIKNQELLHAARSECAQRERALRIQQNNLATKANGTRAVLEQHRRKDEEYSQQKALMIDRHLANERLFVEQINTLNRRINELGSDAGPRTPAPKPNVPASSYAPENYRPPTRGLQSPTVISNTSSQPPRFEQTSAAPILDVVIGRVTSPPPAAAADSRQKILFTSSPTVNKREDDSSDSDSASSTSRDTNPQGRKGSLEAPPSYAPPPVPPSPDTSDDGGGAHMYEEPMDSHHSHARQQGGERSQNLPPWGQREGYTPGSSTENQGGVRPKDPLRRLHQNVLRGDKEDEEEESKYEIISPQDLHTGPPLAPQAVPGGTSGEGVARSSSFNFKASPTSPPADPETNSQISDKKTKSGGRFRKLRNLFIATKKPKGVVVNDDVTSRDESPGQSGTGRGGKEAGLGVTGRSSGRSEGSRSSKSKKNKKKEMAASVPDVTDGSLMRQRHDSFHSSGADSPAPPRGSSTNPRNHTPDPSPRQNRPHGETPAPLVSASLPHLASGGYDSPTPHSFSAPPDGASGEGGSVPHFSGGRQWPLDSRDVDHWTVYQVLSWAQSWQLYDCTQKFAASEVDGAKLLALDQAAIKELEISNEEKEILKAKLKTLKADLSKHVKQREKQKKEEEKSKKRAAKSLK